MADQVYMFEDVSYKDHILVRNWAHQQGMQVKAVYSHTKYPHITYKCNICGRIYQTLRDIPTLSTDGYDGAVYSELKKCCKSTEIICGEGDVDIENFSVRIVPDALLVGTFPDRKKPRKRGDKVPSYIPSPISLEEINKKIIYPQDVPETYTIYGVYSGGEYDIYDIRAHWGRFLDTLKK